MESLAVQRASVKLTCDLGRQEKSQNPFREKEKNRDRGCGRPVEAAISSAVCDGVCLVVGAPAWICAIVLSVVMVRNLSPSWLAARGGDSFASCWAEFSKSIHGHLLKRHDQDSTLG